MSKLDFKQQYLAQIDYVKELILQITVCEFL